MTAAPDTNGGFGLLSLDDLLAESVQEAAKVSATEAARDRLRRGTGNAAERAEDAARIAAWEAQREWDQQANVALFHQFACECGAAESRLFQGLFIREVHRTLGHGSQRWRRVSAADAALPNEVAVSEVATPMCAECAGDKGWAIEAAYSMER